MIHTDGKQTIANHGELREIQALRSLVEELERENELLDLANFHLSEMVNDLSDKLKQAKRFLEKM